MKIDNNDQILKNLYPETKINAQPPAAKEFGTILKESVGNLKKEVTGLRQTNFINPLNGAQMITPSSFDKQFTLDRIENLIGMLDQYRHKLADPAITLKNIDPIIRKIDQETENLAPVLDSLPEGEKLKNIINQTLVTASLEVAKFNRGDYNAP
jgi:exonuclease VII small subunit